ncbi:hypothetical protein PTKIN_Ptkin09bG0167500 [Pterospermum kingtungense]
MAMLASHWGRLVNKGESLVYKVLQEKYFPLIHPMKDIDIFKDNWIMSLPNYKIEFDGDKQPVACLISSLLNPEDNSSNLDIVEQLFDLKVVDAIRKVPVSHFCNKDRLVWIDSPTGFVSIKSAYMVAQSFLNKEVIHNALPTTIMLHQRGLDIGMISMKLYEKFSTRVMPHVSRPTQHGISWTPPCLGKVKINVDATWNVVDNVAVVAVLARDHEGVIVYCSSRKFNNVESVLFAELLAIRCGMELAFFP